MKNRVFLVEDEIIVAMDIRQRLETLGYQVVGHAVTGEEAIRKISELIPDLILMDIKLRGVMDGVDTATKIRDFSDVPIIYLTAFADDNTVARARLTGAFGYLIKPFEDRELHSNIEMALHKHTLERKLRESEERYALAAEAANDGLWDWNLQTGEIYYSPRWISMLGLDGAEMSSRIDEWTGRIHPDDLDRVLLDLDTHFKGVSKHVECEYRMRCKDGDYHWMLCRGLAKKDTTGKAYRIAGSQSDISCRKQMEEQLVQKALYDDLTGFPNRTLFVDRLGVACERAKSQADAYAAILFLDIDHFKMINESLGHEIGNQLLRMIAQRLKSCVRPGDTIGRFGGDEFVILCDGIHQEEKAILVAESLLDELKKPFLLANQEIFSSVSIGIILTTKKSNAIDILRDAETAMYMAKQNGRSRHVVFTPHMREQMVARLKLENELRRALDNHEFRVFYQPIFSISKRRMTGVEALVRWQHPTRGLLLPVEFIQSVEETGLIVPLGEWILRTACKQAKHWHDIGREDMQLSVNLSACQFREHNLAEIVNEALKESGLPSNYLELEITETVAMQDMDLTLRTLSEFNRLGVLISIDDFGSGYSSLDHLKLFPANTLKIDRSFVRDLKPDDLTIVQAMINLAHQLKLTVVAEGVESNEQLILLTNLNCDRVQGFLFGKGVPPEAMIESLSEDKQFFPGSIIE
jgi:diguanylate cyclase (GGDEF)-like protein/PAS domain S-box-containing protein